MAPKEHNHTPPLQDLHVDVDLFRIKSVRIAFGLLVSLIIPISLWVLGSWVHQNELSSLRQQLDSRMNLYASNIVSELEKYEYLPIILSRDPILRSVFEVDASRLEVDRANRHLQAIRDTAEVSAVYIMAPSGVTLAASNWDEEDSFVGRNFKFRPYFQRAMTGEIGHYFALGTTSKIPGYYLSYPVLDNDEVKGVVVVKVSVARLEEAWASSDENVVVSDSNGVIIIASREEWKFRTLDVLNQGVRQQLRESLQYLDAPLAPIQTGRRSEIDKSTYKVSIRYPLDRYRNKDTWTDIYIHSRPVLGTNWTIHYLFEEAKLREQVINYILIGVFFWVIVALIALYVLQRRLYQERHRRTLEKVAVELEQRVDRRTKALQEANQHLEEEVLERKKAQDELHMAQDELVQAGKLAALGQMATGITHEMNQPLTAIRSYADNARVLLKRNRVEDVGDNLELISQLCARLGSIFGQLKVYSRKTPSQIQPVAVKKVITDTLNLLLTTTKMEHVAIQNNVPDLQVMAEAIRLEQVFLNILRNAVDAMENQCDPEIWISASQENGLVIIQIRDNGPGFGETDLAHIFDPFFTTKEVGEGLGLGLSISSRIIRDFGGTLKAGNFENGGAVFTIELKQAGENGGL